MVSLTGTGGIGKTRLAVNVAERLLHQFDDGARFIDLSDATTAEQVGRTVARALQIVEGHQHPAADTVNTALRSQKVLLILDTCERAVRPIADLCQELLETCPDVRILATSRQPLRIPGESIWRVPPLSMPVRSAPTEMRGTALVPLPRRDALRYEAVRLFVNRAHAARTGFKMTRENAGYIVEICRILDGVPLAIELAAARIRVLSVQQILHRLDDRFRLLATEGRELPARQRTMRAVLEWSHALLSEAEQTLLRRLSVFSTWHLELAEDVCRDTSIERESVLELHSSLLDKSLIVLDSEVDQSVHYRLTDTVRAYAAERLAASGEEEVLWDRYLNSTVTWVEKMAANVSGPLPWAERQRYLHRLDHHRENTERLLAWALEYGRIDGGLRLCAALRSYWFVRDLLFEGSTYLRRLLDTTPEAQSPAVRARGLAVYAELSLGFEGRRAVSAAATEALGTARGNGDPGTAACALVTLAALTHHTGDDGETGRRHAREALRISVRIPDHVTEIAALRVLARLARQRGDTEEAGRILNRSISVAEGAGDKWNAARCHNALGTLALQRGDLGTASSRLAEALEIFDELGVTPETARCIAALGHVDAARGDIASARRRLADCLRMSVASGHRVAVARALEALAELAIVEGHPERAAALAGAGTSLRSILGRPPRTRAGSAPGSSRTSHATPSPRRGNCGGPCHWNRWSRTHWPSPRSASPHRRN